LITDSKTDKEETDHLRGSINPEKECPQVTLPTAEDGETNIKVSRATFRSSLKESFREEYSEAHVAAGRLRADFDRRHIISSDEMAKHYQSVLNGLKWSAAKKKLEDNGEKKLPDPPKNADIEATARARHRNFFNDLENLWPGDASVNRSIGAGRDFPPRMSPAEQTAHEAAIYDRYGLRKGERGE
jgi:hypothetical protein